MCAAFILLCFVIVSLHCLLRSQTSDGKVTLRSFNNVTMQLRKIVNHPYLFKNEYYVDDDLWRISGKFEVLDRYGCR